MHQLIYIIQKEFIQIIRNRAILPLMTIAPIVQLILLSYAADNEVKNVRLSIVDMDHTMIAKQLIQKIEASDRIDIVELAPTIAIADHSLQRGTVDIVLQIPLHFQRDFLKNGLSDLQLLVDAINGQQATVGASYLTRIIQDFAGEATPTRLPNQKFKQSGQVRKIETEYSYWFNEELDYKHFMAPGIMGELVTILVMLLTAMNIVREREIGTIEQINVTPIKKWQFIIGKMIPFLIIGIALLTVGLTVGKILFDVPMRGNLAVVFVYCLLNLTAVLGLGLLISNISNTQQQAMFTTFFFVMIFILMSGLFTPIESMPLWAQYLTLPNPVAHFVHVMRAVLLKGSDFTDITFQFQATAALALASNTLAIWTYRKVV